MLRRIVMLFISVGGLALLGSMPARADSCSASCANAVGCYGDCSVSDANCGAVCYDTGCGEAHCSLIGPANLGCGAYEYIPCYHQPPPRLPTRGEATAPRSGAEAGIAAEWAIVNYPEHRLTPLKKGEVILLAASSPAFGKKALHSALEEENRAIVQRRARRRAAGSNTAHSEVLPASRGTGLRVQPLQRPVRVKPSLANAVYPGDTGRQNVSLFFKATTDASGHIESAEVLYTPFPRYAPSMLGFLRQNLTVSSQGSPGPLEVYGALLFHSNHGVGYMIGGAFKASSGAHTGGD